ncbi:MAG: ornithine cyclodeaminase family protein [Synergistales bacterium]|nr:ornithine cyclodeaminase family protein [Synergistales bacterium]
MLALSKDDIQSVFSMKEAIEADKEALRLLTEGKTDVPLRTNLKIPGGTGQSLFMPAYVGEIGQAGVKIVSVFPENVKRGLPAVPATMVLVSGETGQVLSILDGTYLTQLRTGACAGAATDLLARKDAAVGALFGTGGQAPCQLEAILAVRDLELVRVFDIDAAKARDFAERMNRELASYGARIEAAADPAVAVAEADIITAVTTSKRPVLDGNQVKPGAHVNGVGAFTPDMQEIGPELIQRADRVFADSRDAVLAESGDFIKPMAEGTFTSEIIDGEAGDLLLGRVEGRRSDREITFFETVGFAGLDVTTAAKIYDKAVAAGVGTELPL